MTESRDLLCLGSGWTWQFLADRLAALSISYARTTRTAADDSASHAFELGNANWTEDLSALPSAKTVLVIFPIKDVALLEQLVTCYESGHGPCRWLMLGSTGVWGTGHFTSDSPIEPGSARGTVEDRLLQLKGREAAVLNLAGLYGRQRVPANFVLKAAPTADKLRDKNSLHLVHGDDVGQAITAMCLAPASSELWGRRWIISDGNSYDWWELARTMVALPDQYKAWSSALCEEFNVVLPRRPGSDPHRNLTRTLRTEFWHKAGIHPLHGSETILGMTP